MAKRQTTGRGEHIILNTPRLEVRLCRGCGKPSPEVTVAQAMMLTGESRATLRRMMETGRLHHSESGDGHLRICAQSLSEQDE